jgi:tetratricopeptide (TPR) repeat protein
MSRSLVLIFSAGDREVAVELAKRLPDDEVNLVPIGDDVPRMDAVMGPAAGATDVVILWSERCERNPNLPWLLNPGFVHRLATVTRVAIWLFRLDASMPPLDLAAFSKGGGLPDVDLIAAKLQGRPPMAPAGERFFGRAEYARKFDAVFYGRLGMVWLCGLAGVGKRTLARRQAQRYDPNGHRTQRMVLRPGMREVEMDLQLVANMRETTAALREVEPVSADDRPETARLGFEKHVKDAASHAAIWIFEDAHHLLSDDQTPNEVLHQLLLDLRDYAGVTEYRFMAVFTSTRRPRLAPELSEISVVEDLGGLDEVDGVNLLRSRGAEFVEEAVLRNCSVELDGHPLALEIAAQTIAEGQHDWEQTRVRAATEVLASTTISDGTRELLEALAVVDGPIDAERLAGYLRMDVQAYRSALAEALSYSLVQDAEDGYPRLHPLVREYFLQDFRRRADQRERADELAGQMLAFLGTVTPGSRLHVSCALATFRLLGLALRIAEARAVRANLLAPIFEAGVELYRQQRWRDALANFEVIVGWYDDHLEALLYRTRCLARLGEVAEARKAMNALLASHPNDRQVLRVAGRVAYIARNWLEAIGYYRRALDRGPAFPPLLQDLAQALLKVEEWQRAREVLEQLVDTGGGDAYTFGLLADVLDRVGAGPEALENARLACRYDRHNPRHLRRLGELSRRAGHFVEAREAYERALAIDARSQDARLGLAATLLDLGDAGRSQRMLAGVRSDRLDSQAEYRVLAARHALRAGDLKRARRLAEQGLGDTASPLLLRTAAEVNLSLLEADAIEPKAAVRRVEDLIARLRRVRAIPDAEDLAARLDRLPVT